MGTFCSRCFQNTTTISFRLHGNIVQDADIRLTKEIFNMSGTLVELSENPNNRGTNGNLIVPMDNVAEPTRCIIFLRDYFARNELVDFSDYPLRKVEYLYFCCKFKIHEHINHYKFQSLAHIKRVLSLYKLRRIGLNSKSFEAFWTIIKYSYIFNELSELHAPDIVASIKKYKELLPYYDQAKEGARNYLRYSRE